MLSAMIDAEGTLVDRMDRVPAAAVRGGERLRFGVLGPVTVARDGADSPVTAAMPRAVLTALLLRANQPVSVERLRSGLWGSEPPRRADSSLHNHVHRLRRHLGRFGQDRLAVTPSGYVLEIRDGELDLTRFTELHDRAGRARRSQDWEEAADALSAMLALWRGEPASDVELPVLGDMERERLREMRVQALDWKADAELRLGRHAEILVGLRAAVAEHPLAENFSAHLILALHRCGRSTEALEVFHRARTVLRDELGVSPGRALVDLNHAILTRDPRLDWQPSRTPQRAGISGGGAPGVVRPMKPRELREPMEPKASAAVPVPRTLPADATDLVGRDGEIRHLVGLLTRPKSAGPDGIGPGAVVVAAIGGMSGIGKTALAVRAASLVRDQFPDGQLFADLRGTRPSPARPQDVLAMFLRQLSVAPDAVPEDPEERSALFRSISADRRLLLVLDDARDAAQVAPLTPGGAGCAVVVTLRRRLTGLTGLTGPAGSAGSPASVGGRHLDLGALSPEASRQMLDRLVGRARLATEPRATAAVVEACAGLPLALRAAADRLVARPWWRVEDLACRVRPGTAGARRLDALGGETGVRAGFEAGYAALAGLGHAAAASVPTPAQRVFCLLGLSEGAEIEAAEAASILTLPPEEAERLLEGLVDGYLAESSRPGWYRLHPLVRDVAAGRAALDLSPDERRAAAAVLRSGRASAADRTLTALSRPA